MDGGGRISHKPLGGMEEFSTRPSQGLAILRLLPLFIQLAQHPPFPHRVKFSCIFLDHWIFPGECKDPRICPKPNWP